MHPPYRPESAGESSERPFTSQLFSKSINVPADIVTGIYQSQPTVSSLSERQYANLTRDIKDKTDRSKDHYLGQTNDPNRTNIELLDFAVDEQAHWDLKQTPHAREQDIVYRENHFGVRCYYQSRLRDSLRNVPETFLYKVPNEDAYRNYNDHGPNWFKQRNLQLMQEARAAQELKKEYPDCTVKCRFVGHDLKEFGDPWRHGQDPKGTHVFIEVTLTPKAISQAILSPRTVPLEVAQIPRLEPSMPPLPRSLNIRNGLLAVAGLGLGMYALSEVAGHPEKPETSESASVINDIINEALNYRTEVRDFYRLLRAYNENVRAGSSNLVIQHQYDDLMERKIRFQSFLSKNNKYRPKLSSDIVSILDGLESCVQAEIERR